MKTLQIGLEWMPERAGGLPRYFYESWLASHGLYDFRGLVIGSEDVARSSNGEVTGFAPASAPLPRRPVAGPAGPAAPSAPTGPPTCWYRISP